ncbi:MAG: alpha/beta hydrolase [Pseudomonadota bacterium]|jgi:pimeloyl-ACP methyl ester carboxylesterase
MSAVTSFATVSWAGQDTRIEYQWVGSVDAQSSLMVFLHEGLGSVSMWRDFPHRLCTALGVRGLVYSRPGYGSSTPRPANLAWCPNFMHRQADEVLPALLQALEIDAQAKPIWLFGHSDGGSISLLHAAHFPERVAALVVLAPHILVEDITVSSIAQARQAYLSTDLRQRLARHHDNPDSAFWGWNDIWLHPDFKNWRIDAELDAIACPILAVQGLDDEYGTLEQIRGIARCAPQAELLELAHCGHSPHRDQTDSLIQAVGLFFQKQS